MLVSLGDLMREANKQKIAIGAFNCPNLESVLAIVRAAEESNSPAILSYAEVHSELISMEEIAPIMLHFAKKAKVPIAVHLDHGTSIEVCMKAIRQGFTSVMIDASSLSYEENIEVTSQIVKLAHAVGVDVEAELGHIFASDIGIGEPGKTEGIKDFENLEDVYTNPNMAKDFVERTGVDVLAIAFGTTHGIYKTKPVLDLDRILQIKKKIDVPFVMHGGSGLSKEEFQTAIKNGIRKINYYTYMTLAGARAVKDMINKKTDESVFFHDISLIATQEMKKDVKQAIDIFSLRA